MEMEGRESSMSSLVKFSLDGWTLERRDSRFCEWLHSRRVVIYRGRVLDHDQIQPTAASTSSRCNAVFVSKLLKDVAGLLAG